LVDEKGERKESERERERGREYKEVLEGENAIHCLLKRPISASRR
jgi:hypothetical protein